MLSSGISGQDLCPLSVDRPCPGKACTRFASKAAVVPRQIPTLSPRLLARQASRHQRLLPSPAYAEGASGFVPYPYNEQMYHRIQTAMVVAGGPTGEGTIVLMREDSLTGARIEREFCMIMAVAGDTLLALHHHLHGQRLVRPGALDLLWTILMRGQDVSKREWKLVRGAVVEMRGNTYVGRLFFGDSEGNVVWDCDCRPSDALYMTLRAHAPMYINKHVWDESKTHVKYVANPADGPSLPSCAAFQPAVQAHAPMYINKHVWDESKTHVKYVANPADGERAAALLKVLTGSEELPERPLSGKEALVTPRKEDPEPVKRLKREMAVALAEEDYDAAARIRDHPFMVKAMEVLKYRQLGSDSEADRILHDLKSNIAAENERHAQEYQQQRSRSQ